MRGGHEATPRSFWIGLGVGLIPMAWGAWLYLDATPDLRRRLDLAGWMVGLDLAHDLVLAPVVAAVVWLTARLVPGGARRYVQAALLATGVVVLVGWLPAVGSAPDSNDTIQPLDHARLLALVVVALWTTALVAAVVRRRPSPGCGPRRRSRAR